MSLELLKQRIRTEGRVYPGNILKVDSFLNHQIDPVAVREISDALAGLFAADGVSKVLTVEASGIVLACGVAERLGVKALFAKKADHGNVAAGRYTAPVRSYTTGQSYTISVSAEYLTARDRVLIIDDFLAMGEAARGLLSLAEQAGAAVAGLGFAIEKGFQPGGAQLRAQGYRVESLAIVEQMREDGSILFRS